MLSKSTIYGLVGILAGSTITALSFTYATRAAQQRLQSPPCATTSTMPHKMAGTQQVDQHFIEMMIPHHQGAVEMADIALQKSQRPEIKQLATAIKADQTKEIDQMKAWYKQWYGAEVPATPSTQMGSHHGTGHKMPEMSIHSGMMGMGMNLETLKNASDFDKEFIRQMIPHHESAVMMAKMVANNATHPEIRKLAEAIIKSQTAEIQQMQQWYQAWSK
ncbi:DUF305 domain-containing protein [Nostoc spongiaeforme FACHB-130]|uniref:DUF305 domain-containing protein n=1 Tax=Nostoc spongiaeforme FACHB-130 TaxID=1357510 RepID=A0ABR8G1E6_9NOSO|nr:DUF305 domain-containing protein [Nostoc spongiaeforme]MBD2597036.1 DUF305 domain-containing protein [Nostoc spongiaeforme FACHB-130]